MFCRIGATPNLLTNFLTFVIPQSKPFNLQFEKAQQTLNLFKSI